MKNILQVCRRYGTSVSDIAIIAARGFVKAGHRVSFFIMDEHYDGNHADKLDFDVQFFSPSPSKKTDRPLVASLRHLIKEHRFNLVITHRYKPCKLAVKATSGLAIDKRIAVFHGLQQFSSFSRKLFARMYLRNWTIISVSSAVKRDLMRSGAGFRENQVGVIHNGLYCREVESILLTKQKARKMLGIPQEAFVYGNVGRLSDSKNQLCLINAFAVVAKKEPQSILVIIGDGQRRNKLMHGIETLNLRDRIYLTGYQKNAIAYMKAFDVFVFPSKQEGFGMALLEAMVSGIPVIGSTSGGIQEVLGDYPYIAPCDDIGAMTEYMLKLAHIPPLERRALGAALKNRAQAHFDAASMESAYSSLIVP